MGSTQFSTSPVPFGGSNANQSSFGVNGSNGQNFGSNGSFGTAPAATDPWTPVPSNANQTNSSSSPWMKSGGEQAANPFLS